MVRKVLVRLAVVAAVATVALVVLAGPAFAQGEPGDLGVLAEAAAAILGAVAALVLAARGITFLVDRFRDAVPFGDDPRYKIVWGLTALGIGLFATLFFEGTNLIGDIVASLPRGSNALLGTFGEVVTAITLAGLSSSWHDRDVAKNPPSGPTA